MILPPSPYVLVVASGFQLRAAGVTKGRIDVFPTGRSREGQSSVGGAQAPLVKVRHPLAHLHPVFAPCFERCLSAQLGRAVDLGSHAGDGPRWRLSRLDPTFQPAWARVLRVVYSRVVVGGP